MRRIKPQPAKTTNHKSGEIQQTRQFRLFLRAPLSSIADRFASNAWQGDGAAESTRIPEAAYETLRHTVTIIHTRRQRDTANNLAARNGDMRAEKPVMGRNRSCVKGVTGFTPALTGESG
jgi:hypothetical protein